LTETVSSDKVVISVQNTPLRESVVARKTVVYETLVNPTVIRVASEKLKQQLFTRFGFLKPKLEEIQFVSIDKYYEPYIVVSGMYSIDYYRKCAYTIKVDERVLEVILLEKKFVPERAMDSAVGDGSSIRLEGEERLVHEAKSSFIFDRYGRNAKLEKLPSAPSEKNPKKVIAKFGIEEVAQNVDVDFVRGRLFKRPSEIKRVVNELFEVSERVVIYTPQFRILYKNVKTGAEKAMEFDGVTSDRMQPSKGRISQGIRIIKSRFKYLTSFR
jgi:hypothetical protein